jgi:Dicarboxylate transport
VDVSGSVSGRIPIDLDGGKLRIDAGRMENDPPGGVIRYRAPVSTDGSGGLAMAQRALSNLQYEALATDLDYTTTGDLIMKMRLKGINPDMDPLQPVILNLTLENNIPQMLKSLQATRDIQDVIESRTRQQK